MVWPGVTTPCPEISSSPCFCPRKRPTFIVFIRADRCVEGTKYPPRLATSPLRRSGTCESVGDAIRCDGEDIRCVGDETRLDGDETREMGEAVLEREGALITCEII